MSLGVLFLFFFLIKKYAQIYRTPGCEVYKQSLACMGLLAQCLTLTGAVISVLQVKVRPRSQVTNAGLGGVKLGSSLSGFRAVQQSRLG